MVKVIGIRKKCLMIGNLYVQRKVENYQDILDWCKSNNIDFTVKGPDMHVTIAYSTKEVDWNNFTVRKNIIIMKDKFARLHEFGDCLVLKFMSMTLENRWNEFKSGGCSWDFPDYNPHISLSYTKLNVNMNATYKGNIILGPEIFQSVDD